MLLHNLHFKQQYKEYCKQEIARVGELRFLTNVLQLEHRVYISNRYREIEQMSEKGLAWLAEFCLDNGTNPSNVLLVMHDILNQSDGE